MTMNAGALLTDPIAEDRLIARLRIILAFSTPLIVLLNHEDPAYVSVEIWGALVVYAIYSLLPNFYSGRRSRFAAFMTHWGSWGDLIWCLLLVGISGRLNSIFYLGYLFPMLVSSLRWGFAAGARITIISALSFAAIVLFPDPSLFSHEEMERMLLKIAWIMVMGYMMALWGESVLITRRRLRLMEQMRMSSNPRFGITRLIGLTLQRLKDYYGAQSCVMVFADTDDQGFRKQQCGDGNSHSEVLQEPMDKESALRLLDLPFDVAAVYRAKSEGIWPLKRISKAHDLTYDREYTLEPSSLSDLASILLAKHFLTVPIQHRNRNVGRIFVLANRPVFKVSDMRFLPQVLEHVNPIIENILLVEHLASHAADEERRRIARDIHDSIIQPYVGLQMGLMGLLKKIGDDAPAITRQIEELRDLAQYGVEDLRRYISGMKASEEGDGGLLQAVRRFAEKYSDATGIAVHVETEGDVRVFGRLAAEAFHMITEGLSNLRKHTHATRAEVRLVVMRDHLVMEIAGKDPALAHVPSFKPESLSERAASLGGRVRVKSFPDGGNSVAIEIPL